MLLEGLHKKTSKPVVDEQVQIPAAITDAGCERHLNEDRYAVIECASGLAWVVCDGMGGETGGELAAQLAIDALRRDLENLPARSPEVALKSAIVEANRVIVLRRQNQAFASMGTTIVAALFNDAEVSIAHVGDSRAYLIRDGAIQQLTVDHTFVQKLVDSGQIKAEDALSHPQAHILTRAIGSEPGLEVASNKFWVWATPEQEPSDILMLCTDGLYSLISEGELASVVSQMTPQRACVKLVELAKSRGGFDNITVAIIPLNGQLRQEPPIGYNPKKMMKTRGHMLDEAEEVGGTGNFLITLFVVTACVALLVILFFVYELSR